MKQDNTPEEAFHDDNDVLDMEDSGFLSNASDKKKEREEIAKTEGKLVFVLRVAVLVVLVVSAIGVSVGVYQYSSNEEESHFEDKFNSDANKVLES